MSSPNTPDMTFNPRRIQPPFLENIPTSRPVLTIGLELELHIAYIVSPMPDPHPSDPRRVDDIVIGSDSAPYGIFDKTRQVHSHVSNTLCEAGIPCTISDNLYDEEGCWNVRQDGSIMHDFRGEGKENYKWEGVEIVSPALYFCQESLMQIRAVVETLSHKYRIICHESAGLHVHVGYGKEGWEVGNLQKFLALYWTFEPLIEILHPLRRRGIRNYFCYCLRSSRLHMEGENYVRKGVETIFQFGSVLEISHYVNGRGAVNLQNLVGSPDSQTVEFRQHASCLDPDRIEHWIRLVAGMVEFADTIDQSILLALLEVHANKTLEEFSTADFLNSINLPVQAVYFGDFLKKRSLKAPAEDFTSDDGGSE